MERQSAGPASFLGVRKEDAGLLVRIYFLFFVSGMMSTVLGVILPFLGDEHGLSQTVRGALLSAHQIGNLAALFISGILPYAIGRKQNTVLLGSGIVIGLALITLTGNPLILFCAFALTGIGRGTMSNITNVVVGESMANKGAGLNLLHATFAVGAFIAPFMVIALSSSGWRAEPLVIAALMALALVLVVFSPLSSGRSGKDRRKEEFPCSFTFWVNTFIMFFYLCGEASLMGWLVTYFASLDAGAGFSTAMQSLLWIMILAGRLVCAAISARVDKPRLILILGIMMLASFLLLGNVQRIEFHGPQGHRRHRHRACHERHLSDDALHDGQELQQLYRRDRDLHRHGYRGRDRHARHHRQRCRCGRRRHGLLAHRGAHRGDGRAAGAEGRQALISFPRRIPLP